MIRYKRAATEDSEEITNMGGTSTDDLGESGNQSTGRQVAPSHPAEPSGHHDPKARLIYCLVLGFSLLWACVGFALLLTWAYQYGNKQGIGFNSSGQLTNLHPTLMYIFMVTLNFYTSLFYRTHFAWRKQLLKWVHASLMIVSLVAALLGVFVIFRAHALDNKSDWYSLHSWIGTTTLVLFSIQLIAGFVAFLSPGLSAQARSLLMPWHRRGGVSLCLMAALAAITGVTEYAIFSGKPDYFAFGAITFVANMTGVSILFMVACTVYLLTDPKYLRPKLAEEEPLKR